MGHHEHFDRLTARGLLVWALAGVASVIIIMRLFRVSVGGDNGDLILQVVVSIWLCTVFLIWLSWKSFRGAIDIKRLIGRPPPNCSWVRDLVIVIPLVLWSLGALHCAYYMLSFVAPEFVEEFLNYDPLIGLRSYDARWRIFYFFLISSVAIILDPVVEELVFRGILLHRWTAKWSIRRAIFGSSLAFALLHEDMLGAFIFGVVMAILYIKSGTLMIPILCHSANNAVGVVGAFVEMTVREPEASHAVDNLQSELWFGILCVTVSAPWLAYFLVRNWPKQNWRAPYFVQGDRCDAAAGGTAE